MPCCLATGATTTFSIWYGDWRRVCRSNRSRLQRHARKQKQPRSVGTEDRAGDDELHVELATLGAVIAATIRYVCVCVWSLCRATLESPCQHANGLCPELAAVTRERVFVVSEWRVLFFLFSEH